MENVEVDIDIMNEQAHALKRISFGAGAEKKAKEPPLQPLIPSMNRKRSETKNFP